MQGAQYGESAAHHPLPPSPPSARTTMHRSLSIVLLLTGVLLLTPNADAQRRAADGPTHSITLEYEKADAGQTQVQLEIESRSERARAPWGRSIDGIALVTDGGHIIMIGEILSSGHSTGITSQATAFLPTGETVQFILVRGEGGQTAGWNIEQEPQGYDFAKVEWTFLGQDGRRAPVGRNDDADDEGCSTAGCTGIIDPWTCECYEDIRDPWENEVRSDGIRIRI